jgi:hypothetical protein
LDWLALEYDLLLAASRDGFHPDKRILPDISKYDALDILNSHRFAPETSSAQALTLFLISQNTPLGEIPEQFLLEDLVKTACYRLGKPFSRNYHLSNTAKISYSVV